jgi:hypothetical protein
MVSKSILRSSVSLFSSATNLLRSRIISPFLINQVVDSRISECEADGRSLQGSQLYTGHVIHAPEMVGCSVLCVCKEAKLTIEHRIPATRT